MNRLRAAYFMLIEPWTNPLFDSYLISLNDIFWILNDIGARSMSILIAIYNYQSYIRLRHVWIILSLDLYWTKF